jgi:eukaryotic-like serine/threonine-protein kinase
VTLNNSDKIELQRTWIIGAPITAGGFGKIYAATDEHGLQAVIKLVPKAPGASRELLFESLSGHPNIIPLLDTGEWDNHYVLVMPRAEKSLRQHLEAENRLDMNEAVNILLDVAEALASLEKDVVHRDLKPENILFYQGHWCLADFGIARYAEATTAQDTHKYSFTYPYAAPEQWRTEHATPAADVYAFGVLAFELLQGHRPFPGPTSAHYRLQHLNQEPPHLVGISPSIASLVSECLYKLPQARPTAANILVRLRKSQQPSSPAAMQLQAANQAVVERRVQAAAGDSAQRSENERRGGLFMIAWQSFDMMVEELLTRIAEAASSVLIRRSPYATIQLGAGTLAIDAPVAAPAECLKAFGGPAAFDVIAYSTIKVSQPPDRFGYEGRSHALWFCDAHEEGIYRWYETAFMHFPLLGPLTEALNPFAFSPTEEQAAGAFSPGIREYQIAWEPLPFDQGEEEQFIERWIGWFAGAANGGLHSPSQMPERSGGKHRNVR